MCDVNIKQVVALWAVVPCGVSAVCQRFGETERPACFGPEDGGSMFFPNVGIQPKYDMASQPIVNQFLNPSGSAPHP